MMDGRAGVVDPMGFTEPTAPSSPCWCAGGRSLIDSSPLAVIEDVS